MGSDAETLPPHRQPESFLVLQLYLRGEREHDAAPLVVVVSGDGLMVAPPAGPGPQ